MPWDRRRFGAGTLTEEDDRWDEIRDALEDEIRRQAQLNAARAWSTPDDQTMLDLDLSSEEDIWILADFGWNFAVNGDLVPPDQGPPNPPEGFVLTDRGGRVPVVEDYGYRESAVEQVVRAGNWPVEFVHKVLDKEFGADEEIPWTVSGETEVWMRPKIEEGENDET